MPGWGSGDDPGGSNTKKIALAGLALGGLAAATYVMRRRARRQTPFERFMGYATEYLGTASEYVDLASEFARERHPAWWAGLAAAALPDRKSVV